MPAPSSFAPGQSGSDGQSDVRRLQYLVKTLISDVRTTQPVEVIAVTNAGGVSPIGYVDIRPLVSQLDARGNAINHGIIFDVPYLRIQGGTNAVILDPQIGDIGLACFCDRDISTVKASKASGAPGSKRKHNLSDAVYLSSIIGAAPAQYVQFSAAGITVHSPAKIKLEAPQVQIDGSTSITLNSPAVAINSPAITLNGAVTQGKGSNGGDMQMQGPMRVVQTITSDTDVLANGKSGHNHTHNDPQGGSVSPPV